MDLFIPMYTSVFAPDDNPIRSLEISNFSRFIDIDWSIFTMKSYEDLKSKDKPESDYYLGQTISQLKAKKRNLPNKEPSAYYTHFRFLIVKISLLNL